MRIGAGKTIMKNEAQRIQGRIGGGFFNPPIGPLSLSQNELNAVAPPYKPKCQRKKYFEKSPKSGAETNIIDKPYAPDRSSVW